MAQGFGVNRGDVMYNDFLILGPEADPTGIRGTTDAAQAMGYPREGLAEAMRMILAFDREFAAIVAVSLKVAATSTVLGTAAAVPVGIAVAENRFRVLLREA